MFAPPTFTQTPAGTGGVLVSMTFTMTWKLPALANTWERADWVELFPSSKFHA